MKYSDVVFVRILALLSVLMLSNCGSGENAPTVAGSNAVPVSINVLVPGQSAAAIGDVRAALALPGVKSVRITISGAGFAPIIDLFNATPGLVVTRNFQVPQGANISFSIDAFNGLLGVGAVTFTGTSVVTVQPQAVGAPALVINIIVLPTAAADLVAPVVVPPAAALVATPAGLGVAATDPAIAAFLAAATATDNVIVIGGVTNDAPAVLPVGVTTVTFSATDDSANTGTATSTVTIADLAAPVIALLGVTPLDVTQGSVYNDAGATASDNVDGDVTANIVTVNPVNTSVIGTYLVTYDIADVAGNNAVQLVRTVNVLAGGAAGPGKFIYMNNNITPANSVSGFSINPTTGFLTALAGSPFPAGGAGGAFFVGVNSIALSVASNLLFVSNAGSNSISVFSVNPTTGVLSAVAGSPFANTPGTGGGGPAPLVTNQAGTLLFVGNKVTRNISVFAVAANGILTPIAGSPFAFAHSNGVTTEVGDVYGMRLNDSGSILYGATIQATIPAFSVAVNGALTPLNTSPYVVRRQVTSIDLDATSGIAVAMTADGIFSSFSTDAAGALTPITQTASGLTHFFSSLGRGQAIAFTPDGTKVIGSGDISAAVSVVNVSVTGQLTDAPGTPFVTAGGTTGECAIHPNGQFVYVPERNIVNKLEFFTMTANGTLTSQQVVNTGGVGSFNNGLVIY